MDILKNYFSTLLLLTGVVLGGVCGLIFGESASVVKPVGDLFLNMMFVLVVPIVFLSVASAIYQMKHTNMVGHILGRTIVVFVIMSVMSAVITIGCVMFYNPMQGIDSHSIQNMLADVEENVSSAWGDIWVQTLTVPEFLDLFSKAHLLPLIIFSVLFGWATALCGEKGEAVAELMSSAMQVVMRMMDMLMKIAPICLGCYFANTIGNIGTCIAGGMVGALVLYLIVTVIIYFGANTLYLFVTGGVNSLKKYWHHIITPTLTAVATSSSAACIPINILAAKQMGVADNIVETVIPFGTNMHKDGSVAGCAIKIIFLLCVFGGQTDILGNILSIIGLALVCSIVVGAIPSGGMTSELLTCSILGFSPELAGTLLVISTLIDIPATLLNSSGNVVAAVWVDNGMKRMPV